MVSDMPALTRGAAARLRVEGREVEGADAAALLGLREPVAGKAAQVWQARGGVDVYSGATRASTERPQVDHCLEVQLTEVAFVRVFDAERARAGSIATSQALELMRSTFNATDNLNVTSATINHAKRGPFTAALNRLKGDRLRPVAIEQLARQGRNKWMVDDGTWARISGAVVQSYETATRALEEERAHLLPDAARLVAASAEELGDMLEKLGLSS
jgi:hypothetical protein